jgi:RNA polymerase sigma-70 factor (ECF subfamily)
MAALYDETSPFIFGLLTRMLGAGNGAEETLVEVYSRVWRKASSYRPAGGSPLAWLITTARECALKKDPPQDTDGRARGGSRLLTLDEAMRAREAFGGLASKQKETLQLSYFSGLGKVKAAFGLSTQEARSLVTCALKSYAKILARRGNR